MKRLFPLLASAVLLLACDKEEPTVETWTVASEKGVTGSTLGFGHAPSLIVKRGPHADWELLSASIGGFAFERGHEYVLRVRIDPIRVPLCDGPSHRYTLEKQLSCTPARSVDPLAFSPEYEILVASSLPDDPMAAYWFQDLRYPEPRWDVFPRKIEGFDFQPGHEARIRIRPEARFGADNTYTDSDGWSVVYRLTETIGTQKRDSEGLPR